MAEQTPRISVLMPVFNCEAYLEGTLKTITGQSFKDWELIVKDGGSKDRTLEILKEYAARDPRIKVISEPDEGVYDAIHKAAAFARGEFVAVVCASDGYLNMDWFKEVVHAFDADKEVSLVWGIPFDMQENGTLMGPNFIYAHFLKGNTFGQRMKIVKNILHRIDLRHPVATLKNFLKKADAVNLTAARRILQKEAPPQKQDWFKYWLETGITFPDGNMCMTRKAILDCLPPHKAGTREPGDWMGFYYNFNARGYLSYCVPVPANFGRTHGGQLSDKVIAYNESNRGEYRDKISTLRNNLKGGMVEFKDQEGNPIKGPRKLHLGCGEQYLPGYVNIDYPASEHTVMTVKADEYRDIRTLEYPNASIDEVRNHHFFEHFNRAEALKLLVRWHGWLKPNGVLMIETPDFLKCARAYGRAFTQKRRMELGRHMLGSQEAKWAYHYDFWDKPKYAYILTKLGFKDITFDSYTNSFAKHYPRVPLGNLIGNLIPDSVYQKRGGHKLPNIMVKAKKDPAYKGDLIKAAKEILRTYLVGKEGSTMLDVWMKDFNAL